MRDPSHSTAAHALHLAGQSEDGAFFRKNPRATHRIRHPIGVEAAVFGGERLLVVNVLANRLRVPLGRDETPEMIDGFVAEIISTVWQNRHGAEARA